MPNPNIPSLTSQSTSIPNYSPPSASNLPINSVGVSQSLLSSSEAATQTDRLSLLAPRNVLNEQINKLVVRLSDKKGVLEQLLLPGENIIPVKEINKPQNIAQHFFTMLSMPDFTDKNFLDSFLFLVKQGISITDILPKSIQTCRSIHPEQLEKMLTAFSQLGKIAFTTKDEVLKADIANFTFDFNDLGNSHTQANESAWLPDVVKLVVADDSINKYNAAKKKLPELIKQFSENKNLTTPPEKTAGEIAAARQFLRAIAQEIPPITQVITLPLKLTPEHKEALYSAVVEFADESHKTHAVISFHDTMGKDLTGKKQPISQITIQTSSQDGYSPLALQLQKEDSFANRWRVAMSTVEYFASRENEAKAAGKASPEVIGFLKPKHLEYNAETNQTRLSLEICMLQALCALKPELRNVFSYSSSNQDKYCASEVAESRNYNFKADVNTLGYILQDVFMLNIFDNPEEQSQLYDKIRETLLPMIARQYTRRPTMSEAAKQFKEVADGDAFKQEIANEENNVKSPFLSALKNEFIT